MGRLNTAYGYGFDYFYGFIAAKLAVGARLIENTVTSSLARKHLTELMTDQSIAWLKKHRAYSPDKPFFMYWARVRFTARTMWRSSGRTNTKASSTRLGQAAREVFARRRRWAGFLQHKTHPRHAPCPHGQHPDPSVPSNTSDGDLRGFIEYTDAR